MEIIMSFQEKKRIRQEALAKRDQICWLLRKKTEHQLVRKAVTSEAFRSAESILLFAGCGSEIPTKRLMSLALRRGKKLFLPRVTDPSDSQMSFFCVSDLKELQPGYQGILEPTAEELFVDSTAGEEVLVFVPGVAFDVSGRRIGYGKGFYDKFLRKYSHLQDKTIGLGYQCQIVPRIPAEEHDIPVKELWVF